MKKRLIILFIITLLIACSSSEISSNSTPIKPIIEVNDNKKNNKEDKFVDDKIKFYESKDDKDYKGEGVKIGIIDSDFISLDKNTKNFYNKTQTFSKVLEKEFSNRIIKYENNKGILKNKDSRLDYNDDHGIIVASIIAGNSSMGAKKSEIHAMSIKDASGFYIDIDNLKKMKEKGVKIFNNSFGSSIQGDKIINYKSYFNTYTYTVNETLKKGGLNQKEIDKRTEELLNFYKEAVNDGILFIWAAGNSNNGRTNISSSVESALPNRIYDLHKGWISVVGVKDSKSDYSPHLSWAGDSQNWAVSINGDCPISGCDLHGSSFAAPKVSALAAKIKNKYPWMGAHEIQQTILTTAIDMGNKSKYGWGYVNEVDAMKGPKEFNGILLVGKRAYDAGKRDGLFNANINDDKIYYFKNDIKGDGGLKKSGIGILVLEGKNIYKGDTIVENGILVIKNLNMSNIDIKEKGKLVLLKNAQIGKKDFDNEDEKYSGISIGEKNIINHGILEIIGDNSIITGKYISKKGSKIIGEIGKILKAEGEVKIEEKSSAILLSNDNYIDNSNKNITFIETNSNIYGNFDKIETAPLLNVKHKIDNNKILLSVNRKNPVDYLNFIENDDMVTKESATNLEKLFEMADSKLIDKKLLNELINIQNNKYILDSLNSLSGQIHASIQSLIFKQSDIRNLSLVNRFDEIEMKNKMGIWTNTTLSNGKLIQKGYPSAKINLKGVQIGIDKKINENLLLGLAINYSNINAKFENVFGSSLSNDLAFSLYSRFQNKENKYYLQGHLTYSKIDTEVERKIVKSNNIDDIKSKYNSDFYSSYLELGYNYIKDNNKIKPFLAISYDALKRGYFSEKESQLALESYAKVYHNFSLINGINFEKKLNLNENSLKLDAKLLYKKGLNDRKLSFNANYINLKNKKFEVNGINLIDDSIIFGIGLDYMINSKYNLYVNYDINYDFDRGYNNIFNTGLRIEF